MIKTIKIKNFKSIKEQTLVDLPQIVGIWGKNGEGKSTLLQSIIWTMKNKGNLRGNGLEFQSMNNIIFGHNIIDTCEVTINTDNGQSEMCRWSRGNLTVPNKSWSEIRYFPPWRHINGRFSNIREIGKEDLGQGQVVLQERISMKRLELLRKRLV